MSKKDPALLSIVYVLSDRRQSSYYLEDSDKYGEKQYLNTSGRYRLPNTGVRRDKQTKKLVPIRFIAGCDIIDVEEQKKNGYLPNPQADQIWFLSGQLVVKNDGTDVGMAKYMAEISWNKDAVSRPENSKVIFEQLQQDVASEKRIGLMDDKLNAMELVRELATKTPEGFVYDEPKLRFLSALFNIGGLSLPEIVEALYKIALERPDKLLASVADKTSATRVDIAQAIAADAIRVNGDVAMFSNGDKGFYRFTNKAKDTAGRTDELVYFFLTPEGAEHYRQMRVELEYKQKSSLAA